MTDVLILLSRAVIMATIGLFPFLALFNPTVLLTLVFLSFVMLFAFKPFRERG